MYSIQVKNLSKEFTLDHFKHNTLKERVISSFCGSKETYKALEDVSFDVKPGEFFGIIGNNGSGKSTLLKILAGIYCPTCGEVKIKGKLSPFLELGVGFVMELSAWENIFLYGSLLGMSEKQIKERIDDIIAFSELEKFIDTKLNKFSSGMLVRLAFSTAIQADFDILLLDEVLAVGDYNFQMKCREVFADLRKEGKTIVFVSHDLESVKRFCDRVMVLDNGRLKAIGPAKEICQEYLYNYAAKRLKKKIAVINKMTDHSQVVIDDIEVVTLKKSAVIPYGSKIKIKVGINFLNQINNPIVGLEIRNQNNIIVFSTNTLFKKNKLGDMKGRQEFVFEIGQKFNGGEYFVSPAVCDSEQKTFYDWKDDFISFQVAERENETGGLCNYEHDIYVK